LVLALWSATVAGRVLRAPPSWLAVAVTFLPYLYLALGAWVFVLWSALPHRRLVAVALAMVVLSGGLLWGAGWAARTQDVMGLEVRVMTWNVRRLWGGSEDGGDPAQCVVQGIRDQDPDLLTLLEVSRDDVGRLADALGLDCVHTDYRGSGADTAGGLASCALGGRWSLVGGRAQRFSDNDDWHYVFTEMERDGHVLNLLAVHLHPYYPLSGVDVRDGVRDLARGEADALIDLSHTGAEVIRAQGAQSAALLGRVARFRDASVVAGDFNSTRDASLHAALRRRLVDAWERGGRGFGGTVRFWKGLPLRIDYVYVSDAFAVGGTRVPALDCSDHRPVVAELVLREPRPRE
jgi:endonuclease/exonuclease/phosphatase (EEP) superfamily protein YafD